MRVAFRIGERVLGLTHFFLFESEKADGHVIFDSHSWKGILNTTWVRRRKWLSEKTEREIIKIFHP